MAENRTKEVDDDVHSKYEIKKRIGKGAYGIVWQAVNKQTGQTVAVKKIFDAFRNKTDAKRTYREVMFLRQFSHHPNIIKLHQVMKAENDLDLYLILDYMDTDLHQVIKRGNLLKDIHICYIMYQLLRALQCLHAANVIHRDQKPSNILLDADCRVRVADFGLARSLSQPDQDDDTDPSLTEYVATRWYRAPEILLADRMYTTGVDMWSAGCILAEMLLGKPIFPGSSTLNQIERIMSAVRPPSSTDIRGMCSGYALTVLERACNKPKRPLRDVLHMATDDSLDLVTSLLVFSPNKRLSAEQALQHPYFKRVNLTQSQQVQVTATTEPSFSEEPSLTIDEYRQKIYQLSTGNRDGKVPKKNGMLKDMEEPPPPLSDDPLKSTEKNPENGGEITMDRKQSPEIGQKPNDPSSCSSSSSSESTTTVNQIEDSTTSIRKSNSQDCIRTATTKKRSSCQETVAGSGVLPAAGLPSQHPRANTASAWLRFYHIPSLLRYHHHRTPPITKKPITPKEKVKPNYGRRQFANHGNVSSLGSPKLVMRSYTQSHGTIAASALQQLRITK